MFYESLDNFHKDLKLMANKFQMSLMTLAANVYLSLSLTDVEAI